jgi:hypothetical protein
MGPRPRVAGKKAERGETQARDSCEWHDDVDQLRLNVFTAIGTVEIN